MNNGCGIYTGGNGGSLIEGNHLSQNSSGGIVLGDSNNYVVNNHVVNQSGEYGISVNNSANTNNVVVGGGPGFNYSNISGVSDFGPIDSVATATSPVGKHFALRMCSTELNCEN